MEETQHGVQQIAAREQACRQHWRFNLLLTATVLLISALVSFAPPVFAHYLGQWRVMGMPLPFYMGAQGAVVVYALLVVSYAVLMRRADRRLSARLCACDAAAGASVPRAEISPASRI